MPEDRAEDDAAVTQASVRERLNDNCEGCGKPQEDADSINPVTHGRWSLGPAWYCRGCCDAE